MNKYVLGATALLILPIISLASYANPTGSATFVGTTATTTPATGVPVQIKTETEPARVEMATTEVPPSSVAPQPEKPQEAGSDYLLELGGVDGESTEKKKGNVDYQWKVEEGEKAAASDMYIKFDGIDGEAASAGGVRVAVGDVDGDGRVEVTDGVVQGVIVRGWDPEKKKEVLGKAPATAEEVEDEEGLALFIAKLVDEDSSLEEVSFNFEKITVKYDSEAKLLGFIPIGITIAVDALLDEEGVPRVSVKFPWYSFLVSESVSADDIIKGVEEETAKNKDKHKDEIHIESFSFGASQMGTAFSTISNVLKTKHDTAKNSVGNVR